MSTFPNFTNIPSEIINTLSNRKSNQREVSKLNCWVRISCGADPGLSMTSNPNYTLFNAASGIYGNHETSGVIGYDWRGNTINSDVGQPYRPSPVVSGLSIDEGAGEISRKAEFSITAFSKEQMERLCEFFLEPGFSMFIEWGWNTNEGVGGLLGSLDADSISHYQSFVNTNNKRKETNGHYDNYLGFITGGSVSVNDDKWTISVKCSGYAELPAFLVTNENGEQNANETGKYISSKLYGELIIEGESNKAKQRWMRFFNELVDSKQIEIIKDFERDIDVVNINNFINFDDDIANKINSAIGRPVIRRSGRVIPVVGGFIPLPSIQRRVGIDDEEFRVPRGTELITPERYVRFGTLMKIISTLGFTDLKVGTSTVSYKINTENTYCSAFNNIFSVDETKLFIPNPNTPRFGIETIARGSDISMLAEKIIDNSVNEIQFPEQISLENYILPESDPINKEAGEYGRLDNLYVNFDFIKGILNTPNLYIKDALYQILNGISSAVNGMWNFQIVESSIKKEGETDIWTELQIHELNFISNDVSEDGIYTIDLIGDNSILINSTFDMNISGAKMNQIIGNRLGKSINFDNNSIPKNLFSTRRDLLDVRMVDDRILVYSDASPYSNPVITSFNQSIPSKPSSNETDGMSKSEALDIWLGKAVYVPKVDINKSDTSRRINDVGYLVSYRDPSVLSAFIRKHNTDINNISPLMPISFGFTVHGISGIARGQKFKVSGIPSQYENGFFQVLSVKHNIDGMMWTTEVEGGYRQK